METNAEKIDETFLAVPYLTLHDGTRAWKGFDWDTLNRLHAKGLISDPVSKAKSVVLAGIRAEQSQLSPLPFRRRHRGITLSISRVNG
jgi:Domain of unknown function (DUF6429)